MKILLTGFKPWGTHRVNPSGVVSRALGGHELSVHCADSTRELDRLIGREKPDAIVMLGLAATRTRICLEAIALNVDHEEGGKRRPIVKGGPLALQSQMSLDPLYRRLKQARVPVAISHHAGTYVCNHLYYHALTRKIPCVFVHVPPFKALAQARQVRTIRSILDALGGSSPAATP